MSRKIEIPKHIDFQPAKEFEEHFDRVNNGFVQVNWKHQIDNVCIICGKPWEFSLKTKTENGKRICIHDAF